MVSMQRVLTVIRKDVFWAIYNLKLLTLMVLPAFLVVFFSKMDSTATFDFSLSFVNAFVGIFITSYLVIEEKNKGTLLALLTTPLTSAELLLGKFLFNLILCLGFSFFALILNNRLDILTNPLVLGNIVLFAGTCCFVGYTMGVFFKNEQEMGILAPIIMLLFIFGGAVDKASLKENVHAYFPDFHLARSLRDISMDFSELLTYFSFSLVYFLVAFAMAAFYTNFFFSNNREKRFSKALVTSIACFFIALIVSGLTAGKFLNDEKVKGQEYYLLSKMWKVGYYIDSTSYALKPLFESRTKSSLLLPSIKDPGVEIIMSYREAEADEKDIELRKAKVMKDKKRIIISHQVREVQGRAVTQWVYTSDGEQTVLVESFCGPELLQWSLDVPLGSMKNFEKHFKAFQAFEKSFTLECKE